MSWTNARWAALGGFALAVSCCVGDPYEQAEPPTGTAGSSAGTSTTTTPSGGSTTGGGGTGQAAGGAGGATAGAGGVGAFGGVGGGIPDSCASFDPSFQPSAVCLADGSGGSFAYLRQYTSDFANNENPGFISQWGNCPDTSVAFTNGQLVVSDCDGEQGDDRVYVVTPLASTRDCLVRITVVDFPGVAPNTGSATFVLRNEYDPDGNGPEPITGIGSIHVGINERDDGTVALLVARYDDSTSGATTLGWQDGFSLPLRLFIANDHDESVCAGAVDAQGNYQCVGCWDGDFYTSHLLDEGRVLVRTDVTAAFDDLNVL